MSNEPRVSVVLPTYNRRDRLARVLSALDAQSVPPDQFEVIVVDDGSSDGTKEWLAGAGGRGYALQGISQPNGGPARARNTGIAAARGKLLLFLDDDVEPTPELVAEHLKSHDAEADVVVMGPLASLESYAQPWVTWEQVKLEAQYAAMARGDWKPTFRQFWTGNASVAKAAVVAVGCFNTSFKRAEDVELARRLHERGMGFRFNPKARGFHHAERSLAAWVNMHASYGALEVEIFGALGEERLVQILSGNWSRVNPASRWLVRRCLGHAQRHAAASRALQSWLKLAERTSARLLTDQVCGALANLTYWTASATAMGEDLTERVFATGERART